jgi:hypothetical protein
MVCTPSVVINRKRELGIWLSSIVHRRKRMPATDLWSKICLRFLLRYIHLHVDLLFILNVFLAFVLVTRAKFGEILISEICYLR